MRHNSSICDVYTHTHTHIHMWRIHTRPHICSCLTSVYVIISAKEPNMCSLVSTMCVIIFAKEAYALYEEMRWDQSFDAHHHIRTYVMVSQIWVSRPWAISHTLSVPHSRRAECVLECSLYIWWCHRDEWVVHEPCHTLYAWWHI